MKFTFILSALLFGRALGQNVVEVAVGAPSLFSELVDLVLTAGLDGALSTTDPITVFAPTDDAFGKLHASSLSLLKSETWRPHLENLLLQHVLSGEVPSSDITDGLTVAALNGENVKLNLPEGGGVVVNDSSNVVQADVPADNGVIHAVDTVLFPEWVHKNLYQRASDEKDLSTLVQLINGLHLAHALSFNGPYTVFAPTNDAFFEGLTLLGEDDGVIDYHLASNLLTYHVVYGIYSKKDIEDGLELTTAQGEKIKFSFSGDTPQVNGENIIAADVLANNGIVHVIDGLLIPDSVTPAPLGSVVDVALDNNDTFSSLVEFVGKAGLVTPLASTQGITVFAPTNDAFAALASAAPDVVANLQTDEEWVTHLQDVLLYHVLDVEVPASAVTDGLTATALNGENVTLSVNADGIFVNTGSEVIITDVDASNGVIHAIDNVLLPSWVTNSIVDRAVASPSLSKLVELVVAAELGELLSEGGPFTVFAPTNDAFAEFLGDDTDLDMGSVANVLTYHVVPGIYSFSEIENGLTLPTAQGEELSFSLMGSTGMVNGETIVMKDILANNGIVHVIDGVLVPTLATEDPQTVVDVASSNDAFTTLVSFAGAADLVTALDTTEGITVFAPTNDAFDALASAAPDVVANLQTDEEWVTHLQDVLLFHVLDVEVPASAVTDGLTATALNGENVTLSVNADGIFVNTGSEVIITDVDASNGVIHAIDNVLLPSWVTNSIVDRAVASPILTNLVTLVLQAGLADALSGVGPFTVFAPTDDAFAEFLNGADPSELDPEMVAQILTYHVVPGIHTESEIENGLTLKTLQGEDLTFSVMGNTAMVNGETIVATDILANNGVVHVIDGVLVPDEATASVVMEAAVASQRSYGNVGGNTNANTDTNIMAMLDSEQASSASFYRATVAAATTALVGFGVAIGAVF